MANKSKMKTAKTPSRPYEKARIDQEILLAGKYGLKNKREIWRVQLTLGKIRKAARELLKLDEKDPKRLFEGNALIRRLIRIGVLQKEQNKLDHVLSLTVENFLDRRLQTLVYKAKLAKSIHHARVLINQRHIHVGGKLVNVPSFTVRTDFVKLIEFAPTSSFGGTGKPGRITKRKLKTKETEDKE